MNNPATCAQCLMVFTSEHPKQTVCRLCVHPRCPVCRGFLPGSQTNAAQVYCSDTCRQRARAGDRYMILNRDNFTCRVCSRAAASGSDGAASQGEPGWVAGGSLLLNQLVTASWGAVAVAGNTVTLCDSCSLPTDSTGAPAIPVAWVLWLEKRNSFFAIDPNKPLKGLSRGAVRRRTRHGQFTK